MKKILILALFITTSLLMISGLFFKQNLKALAPDFVNSNTLHLPKVIEDVKDLEVKVLEEGEGKQASAGDTLRVHYLGRLEDGTVFDSSYPNETPFELVLGENQTIPGFEQGINGMKVGEKREITIPPHLGYGSNEVGNIPPNSTLIFEVELIEILEEPSTNEEDNSTEETTGEEEQNSETNNPENIDLEENLNIPQ